MADEFDAGDAMPGKKLLFKWKNYQQQTHCFSQNFQTSRPPGPYLRSDEIGDRDPMAVQAPGQAEIEVGEINENGGRRRRRTASASSRPSSARARGILRKASVRPTTASSEPPARSSMPASAMGAPPSPNSSLAPRTRRRRASSAA